MLYFLLVLNGILLVLPKLILIKFTNDTLWGDVTLENFGGAIAQDVALAIAAIIFALWIIRKGGWKRVAVGAAITGCLLFLLMVDARTRELWIKPIDFDLLRYSFVNAGGLTSGTDLFFNYAAGLGMTFRRLLFFVCLAHIANWCLIGWVVIWKKVDSGGAIAVRPFAMFLTPVACLSLVIAFLGASNQYHVNENVSVGPLVAARNHTMVGYRYRMNENFIVSALIKPSQWVFASESNLAQLADGFEQKPQPLSRQPERTLLRDIKPFKNVVVIVYESVRWRGLNLVDDVETPAPNLARMAQQGMISKSYVAVPHSAKSYFAVLSGRYPYPGVEAREAIRNPQESIWHQFIEQKKGVTFAFSSLFFGFENMGGELKSLGIKERFQTEEMAKAAGKNVAGMTSFGSSDELLYESAVEYLSKVKTPYAAIFFPSAAHYPYECPGANAGRHSYDDYMACIKYSDRLLGKLVAEFRQNHLLEDTLFVIVGDHGESFGEHGLFVHNSSMYEEEITVPLIFWSDDDRLTHHLLPKSRQIDIAPTIADLLDMMNNTVPVQGVSLLRQNGPPPAIFASTFFEGVGQALVEGSDKYIYEASKDQLLAFDLKSDSNERSPRIVMGKEKIDITARLRAFSAYQELSFPRP